MSFIICWPTIWEHYSTITSEIVTVAFSTWSTAAVSPENLFMERLGVWDGLMSLKIRMKWISLDECKRFCYIFLFTMYITRQVNNITDLQTSSMTFRLIAVPYEMSCIISRNRREWVMPRNDVSFSGLLLLFTQTDGQLWVANTRRPCLLPPSYAVNRTPAYALTSGKLY